MGTFELTTPPVLSGDLNEQIHELRNYLYQTVEQINSMSGNLTEDVFTEISSAISIAQNPAAQNSEDKGRIVYYQNILNLLGKTGNYIFDTNKGFSLHLSSEYVKASDFNTYFANARAVVNGNAVGITQLYNYSAGIRGAMADINVNSDTFIKTGLLYYDGDTPIYGVGVGNLSTTIDDNGHTVLDRSNLMATYSADEIAFWHNDVKMAYITQESVYFPNATITAANFIQATGSFSGSLTAAETPFTKLVSGNTCITSTTICVDGSIYPYTSGTEAIGSEDKYWSTVYASEYSEASAERFKKNIVSLPDNSYTSIMDLRPVLYQKVNDDSETKYIGFIAEEVEKICPYLVKYMNNGEIFGLDYSRFCVLLTAELQKLIRRIEKLEDGCDF